MTLAFNSSGVMEYLWSQIEKTADGNIRYTLQEIDTLWWMGFVDTRKHPLDMWRAVFEPYRQADGSYILNEAAFLALDVYRYTGEIKVPFDAQRINEGKYTDEGLHELFDLSIEPSVHLPSGELDRIREDFAKRHREAGGLIVMNRRGKEEIAKLIDEHPSPLRNLELTLDRMLAEGVDEDIARQLSANETARATTEVAKQVSRFSSAPLSRSEIEAKRLGELARTRAPATHGKSAAAPGGGTELKKIRRSRKGMRG